MNPGSGGRALLTRLTPLGGVPSTAAMHSFRKPAAAGAGRIAAQFAAVFAMAVAAMCAPSAARAQVDLQVRVLENEVMRLQRELDAQSRRIDDLERNARNPSVARPPVAAARPEDSSPAWLVSGNWDRIRTGMKELDVIALLGRPTSVRTEQNGKVRALLYALELGPTAVLAGNVQMSDAGVVEINRPVLR